MASKIQTLRYREKNTNVVWVRLFRAGLALLPSLSVGLFLELRREPTGRLLYSLPLIQPLSQDTLLKTTLPIGLETGIYYVDLRQEQTGLPERRTGICQILIFAIGSLETSTDNQPLNVTISEAQQLLEADLGGVATWTTIAW